MNSIDKRFARLQAKADKERRESGGHLTRYRPNEVKFNKDGHIIAEIVSNEKENIVGLTFKKLLSPRQKRLAAYMFAGEKFCRICHNAFETDRDKHIDHCHVTGVVRGVLCHRCNLGLGLFRDNKNTLLNAVDYLEQYKYNVDLIE